jgi:hypothetical protein
MLKPWRVTYVNATTVGSSMNDRGERMITWLKLKTKPFADIEDAEKFIRHFKFFNPRKEFKTGTSEDDDGVVFVGSMGAEIRKPVQK